MTIKRFGSHLQCNCLTFCSQKCILALCSVYISEPVTTYSLLTLWLVFPCFSQNTINFWFLIAYKLSLIFKSMLRPALAITIFTDVNLGVGTSLYVAFHLCLQT